MTTHSVKVAKITNQDGHVVTVSFDYYTSIIFISEIGIHFEAEAYHLESWCKSNGYTLEIKEFDLEV